MIVIKNDKSLEQFDRDKLLNGLLTATKKREISMARLNEIIDEVEHELRSMVRNEVRTEVIGDLVLERLRQLDDVAYIRFASVYKDFKNIEEFQTALASLD